MLYTHKEIKGCTQYGFKNPAAEKQVVVIHMFKNKAGL